MVLLIDAVKALLGPAVMNWLVLVVCLVLSVTFTLSRIQKEGFFPRFHVKDGWGTGILYYLSLLFAVMIVFNVGPADSGFRSRRASDQSGGSTLFTVTIAGWLVTFLIEFGVLEFVGTLMEPIMRKAFKLPGQSAVTCVSRCALAPTPRGGLHKQAVQRERVYRERGVLRCHQL